MGTTPLFSNMFRRRRRRRRRLVFLRHWQYLKYVLSIE
jgi:hypothetical protein